MKRSTLLFLMLLTVATANSSTPTDNAEYYRERLVICAKKLQQTNEDAAKIVQNKNEAITVLKIDNERLRGEINGLQAQLNRNTIIAVPFTDVKLTTEHIQGMIFGAIIVIIIT